MAKKLPEEIKKMLLKMESEIDESKVVSKKGKLKGAPVNIVGKIYRDTFGIRREGSIYTNPNAVIVHTLKRGIHDDWNKIPIGTKPDKLKYVRGFVRRAKIRIEFQCCYNGNPMNDPVQLDVELEDIYDNKDEAYRYNNLYNWLNAAFRESVSNTSEEECSDWNEAYTACEKSRKLLETLRKATEGYEGIDDEFIKEKLRLYEEQRQQILIKRQKAQEKAEQRRKAQLEKLQKKQQQKPKPEPIIVPVTIDEEPITLIFKKELTTMNVIQISRLAKSITKLEEIKNQQESFLNMYNERIKSGRIDLLLSSTKQRDEWEDIIKITNIKIERQKEAIQKIQLGG